jgi:hypothetical protein
MNISVIENLIDEQDFQTIQTILHNYTNEDGYPGWKLIGFSSNVDQSRKFWYIPLKTCDFFTNYLFNKIQKTIKESLNEEITLGDVYFNGATFGQQGYPHQDTPIPEGRTLLIYCNPVWKTEWSGATVFATPAGPITVYPHPAKAIYFPGNIPHFSQSLSADFTHLRVTLAYKTKVK